MSYKGSLPFICFFWIWPPPPHGNDAGSSRSPPASHSGKGGPVLVFPLVRDWWKPFWESKVISIPICLYKEKWLGSEGVGRTLEGGIHFGMPCFLVKECVFEVWRIRWPRKLFVFGNVLLRWHQYGTTIRSQKQKRISVSEFFLSALSLFIKVGDLKFQNHGNQALKMLQ